MNSSLKKFLKYSLNILLIIGISFLALHILFKDNDPKTIIKKILEVDVRWIALAALLMIIFICAESIQFRMLFKGMKQKVSLIKCLLLSNIGFFFSQITPGASGGQPLQIVYMMKLGVNPFVSTLVCMLVTLIYKMMLVFLFILALILRPALVGGAISDVLVFFIIGIICQAGFAFFLLMCIFKPVFASWIVNKAISLGHKLHIIKNPDCLREKADHSIKQYEAASNFLKKNPHVMLKMAGITFIQRIAYFMVTFCVARSLRIVDCNVIDILSLQIILSLAVDVLPIPGASGANEIVFARLQVEIFGDAMTAGLLMNRCITYYFLAMFTGIFTLIAHLYFNMIAHRREREKKPALEASDTKETIEEIQKE